MNILILTYEGGLAGATFSIFYLARGLAEKGHNVYVGCRKQSDLYGMLADTKAEAIPMAFRSRVDTQNMRQIAELVRTKKIDIINAQAGNDRYISVLAKWFFGLKCKIIHTRRNVPFSALSYFQRKFYEVGTDYLVAISDELKRVFVQKGFRSEQVKVIYNGVPPERYKLIDAQKVEALRQQYKPDPDTVLVGCISRKKRQGQLVEALQYLPKHVKVLLVGVVPGFYDEIANQAGVTDRVIYAGKVPFDEVLNYYKILDINTLISITEGFGLTLVESMGMETPVVATRAAGIINVVKENETGLLFQDDDKQELAQKIMMILEDKDLREKLIRNGKKSAEEEFSIQRTIDNYEKFFLEIIN